MSNKLFHTAVNVISALLIVLFVYTAINKFSDHERFEIALHNSPLLKGASFLLAWFIPSIELVMSVLLFNPSWRKEGLLGSSLLMAAFTIYVSYMILFVPNLPCSCGGVISKMTWGQHLVFNIFFTALAITGYLINKRTQRFIAINRSS